MAALSMILHFVTISNQTKFHQLLNGDERLLNAANKVEFINLINKKLPKCLEIIVNDTFEKNTNTKRFQAIKNDIDFTKCTYEKKKTLLGI